jgi:hypothetical protein
VNYEDREEGLKLSSELHALIEKQPLDTVSDEVVVRTVEGMKLAFTEATAKRIRITPNDYVGTFTLNHPAAITFDEGAQITGLLTVDSSDVVLLKPKFRPFETGLSLTLVILKRGHRNILMDQWDIDGLDNGRVKRGIAANMDNMIFQNGNGRGIWSKGQDSQVICGWESRGPVQIRNNFLEAASENIMFGGADPIPNDVVPSVIIIENNTITKRIEWKPLSGTGINVKNLIELKSALDVIIRGNKFSNCWTDGQTGTGIVVHTRNQSGSCPTCGNERVLIERNEMDNVNTAFTILGRDYTHISRRGKNYIIRDNIFTTLNYQCFQINAESLFTQIDHNTFIPGTTFGHISKIIRGGAMTPDGLVKCGPQIGFRYTNNISMNGRYGLWSEEGGANAKGFGKALLPDAVCAGNIIGGYPFVESHNYSVDTNALISTEDWNAGVAAADPNWFIDKSTDGTPIGRRT